VVAAAVLAELLAFANAPHGYKARAALCKRLLPWHIDIRHVDGGSAHVA